MGWQNPCETDGCKYLNVADNRACPSVIVKVMWTALACFSASHLYTFPNVQPFYSRATLQKWVVFTATGKAYRPAQFHTHAPRLHGSRLLQNKSWTRSASLRRRAQLHPRSALFYVIRMVLPKSRWSLVGALLRSDKEVFSSLIPRVR